LTSDSDIKQFAKHGWLQADLQANDIDVLDECAMKADVVSYLADEINNEKEHSTLNY
jgi:hypothetical protein